MISGIVMIIIIIIIMLTKHPRHGFLVFGELYMMHCECKHHLSSRMNIALYYKSLLLYRRRLHGDTVQKVVWFFTLCPYILYI